MSARKTRGPKPIEQLRLCNQLCFPLYTASRLIIRLYTPLLSDLGMTYPQYLVMLVLWEHGRMTVNEIKEILYLDNNTVSPLLQRMEKIGLLKREHDESDHRKVIVKITPKGARLKEKAKAVPGRLFDSISKDNLEGFDYETFYNSLQTFIGALADSQTDRSKDSGQE